MCSHHLLYTLLTSYALALPLVLSPHLASSINRTQNRSLKRRMAKKNPKYRCQLLFLSFFCQLPLSDIIVSAMYKPDETWKELKEQGIASPKWIMLNFLIHFTLYFRVSSTPMILPGAVQYRLTEKGHLVQHCTEPNIQGSFGVIPSNTLKTREDDHCWVIWRHKTRRVCFVQHSKHFEQLC